MASVPLAPTGPLRTPLPHVRSGSWVAPLLAFVLGGVVVLDARWGPDWPAQEFRTWIAAHDGLVAWTSRWYGGQALPGYSVLYPAFGALLGTGLTGLVAVVLAAWAADAFAPARPRRVVWYRLAVAVSLTENLLIGQVPYLLGIAFGLVALRWAAGGRSPVAVAVLAAACSLASPLAGLSMLLGAPTLVERHGLRRAVPLVAALAGMAVSAVVGGAGGTFPFPSASLLGVVVFCLAVLVAAGPDRRGVRWFAWAYLLVALAAFAVPNAVGGNIARVGKIIALPLAIRLAPWGTRAARRVLAFVAVGAAASWPAVAFGSSILRGATDPSQRPQFYTGLMHYLGGTATARTRIEIPFTREHWEALWVARDYPIARGWERQSDLLYNQVLYAPLTAASYRSWLDANAVTTVALPRAPIDYGGRAEAALLEHPPSYLRPVFHDADWQVWQVIDPAPLVVGAASSATVSSSSVTLQFTRPGRAVVKIHSSRLWEVVAGDGCTGATPGGWLSVTAERAGRLTVNAELNRSLVTGQPKCGP